MRLSKYIIGKHIYANYLNEKSQFCTLIMNLKYFFTTYSLVLLFVSCELHSSTNLLMNNDFSVASSEVTLQPLHWKLGGAGTGSLVQAEKGVHITHQDGEFVALYQDINDMESFADKEFLFEAKVRTSTPQSVKIALYDGVNWWTSPYHSGSGQWETVSVRGTLSSEISHVRAHLWLKNEAVISVEKSNLEIDPAISTDKIEFYYSSKWNHRKVYRSKRNNIAISFMTKGIYEEPYYANFFAYDLNETPYDYFCIPDDYIIAYDTNTIFKTKAIGLNWNNTHGLAIDHKSMTLSHIFKPEYGFSKYTLPGGDIRGIKEHGSPQNSNWTVPPFELEVNHTMRYDEFFVPMTVNVRNVYSKPLRFIYIFQDGAWMTNCCNPDGVKQRHVHQYWSNGEYGYAKLLPITNDNIDNKTNWVGMYNDQNGGMFSAVYAPPESKGIRFHATWDNSCTYMGQNANISSIEDMMRGINSPDQTDPYDSNCKIRGTLIDFGLIQPGEERKQVIVKIMFTGYKDRKDMDDKIKKIIKNIPKFDIPSYDLGTYNDIFYGSKNKGEL